VAAPSLPPAAAPKGRVCLVVADNIYDAIASNLVVYQQDLTSDGFTVTTYRFTSGAAESLRSFLAGLRNEPSSLVGAVLIGDIPYIVYEMMQDWGDGDPPEYDDFPCDMFYMDLNGRWADALEQGQVHAGNGKYDTHTGDTNLEIWVSRLKTSTLPSLGSETQVLTDYFLRNHGYRQGLIHPAYRSLIFDDDDWVADGTYDTQAISRIYCNSAADRVDDPEATTASAYLGRLGQGYELVHTRSHGYTGGHMYYRDSKAYSDWVMTSDYIGLDPSTLFYSVYVCTAADYTVSDYLAGVAALGGSGLLAWSSSKTGGMWYDDPFYLALANGACFGQAFRDWFNKAKGWYPEEAPRYWYGMELIGDATLPGGIFHDVRPSYWASREIAACANAGVVAGYTDGNYRPVASVTRDQMAVYISRALAGGDGSIPNGPATPSFSDVPSTQWAYKHIEYAVSQNVVKGYEDGTYHPEYQVDRGQMAVYLARAMVAPGGDVAVPDPVPPATFPDVPETFWAYKQVEYCVGQGVVKGYDDGLYHPERVVTRDQMAVYIARAFGLL
jgi:hypothetical protein